MGAVIGKEEKCFYINVLVNMTKDCDCQGENQRKFIPDVGVLGSYDPVALDKATLDLTAKGDGVNLAQRAYQKLSSDIQLEHAVRIGLGSMEYELQEVAL